MFLKNICACLVTINSPGTTVYRFTKGTGESLEFKDVEAAQGSAPVTPKGFKADQVDELRSISGKSFDLKPAGPAVEIPAELYALPAVKQQVDMYVESRDITELGDKVDDEGYDVMERVDLESIAKAYSIEYTNHTSNDELIAAIKKADAA